MDPQFVMSFGQEGLTILLAVAAPVLLTVLAVGLVISVLQAATQIQEATMSFVPKVVSALLSLAIAGPWMISTMVDYLQRVLQAIPTMVA